MKKYLNVVLTLVVSVVVMLGGINLYLKLTPDIVHDGDVVTIMNGRQATLMYQTSKNHQMMVDRGVWEIARADLRASMGHIQSLWIEQRYRNDNVEAYYDHASETVYFIMHGDFNGKIFNGEDFVETPAEALDYQLENSELIESLYNLPIREIKFFCCYPGKQKKTSFSKILGKEVKVMGDRNVPIITISLADVLYVGYSDKW